jgi:small subunit ribosomal protein S10
MEEKVTAKSNTVKVTKPRAKKATTVTTKATVKKEPTAKKTTAIRAATAETKSSEGQMIRIRVAAYESKVLDQSVRQIMDTAMRHDAGIRGPVPLPTEIKKYTVNRSSFIDKNSREQFEIRIHRRLIDILNPSPKIVEALTNLNLPSGVNVDVKMI